MSKKNVFRKVIFSGGYATHAKDGGAAFCSEIVRDLQYPVKILECIFGLPEDLWEGKVEKDQELFQKMMPSALLEFKIANPHRFIEQIEWADVVYFRGGETRKFLDSMTGIQGLKMALKGKTIIGSSAGAYVLSELYVHSAPSPELRKGLGLVPVKTVTHYRSTLPRGDNRKNSRHYWDLVDKLMREEKQYLTSIRLREGEYEVISE